jgi:Transposase DDE domain
MDRRLQNRYRTIVTQQVQAAQALAAGLRALPGAPSSFAATQAAWRFLNNPRVGLPQLVEPLREAGRQAAAAATGTHLLVVHDWSFLSFPTHTSKADRIGQGAAPDLGYDLATALLVDGATGSPLAPMDLELATATGVVSSRADRPPDRPADPHIDQVLATMTAAATWGLARPVVHVIDREADGLAQFRTWASAGYLFVVRVDANRRVRWRDRSRRLPEIVEELRAGPGFEPAGELGEGRTLFVADTTIVYTQPGRVRRGGRRLNVPGGPLEARLVVSQVRDAAGGVLAEWLLVTNVGPAVSAAQVGRWYAWRWRIESFFKLLKGHGQQVEQWQQETGEAIAKRLAVTAMACVLVWRVVRDPSPAGRAAAAVLVRLSGRQVKRARPVTAPAVLAGLEKLLAVLDVLEETSVEELRALLHHALAGLGGSG